MIEDEVKKYDKVFEFIETNFPNWEKLVLEEEIKIKTNQHEVCFNQIEEILKKFNLRITNIAFTDYYGIVFGIKILK